MESEATQVNKRAWRAVGWDALAAEDGALLFSIDFYRETIYVQNVLPSIFMTLTTKLSVMNADSQPGSISRWSGKCLKH